MYSKGVSMHPPLELFYFFNHFCFVRAIWGWTFCPRNLNAEKEEVEWSGHTLWEQQNIICVFVFIQQQQQLTLFCCKEGQWGDPSVGKCRQWGHPSVAGKERCLLGLWRSPPHSQLPQPSCQPSELGNLTSHLIVRFPNWLWKAVCWGSWLATFFTDNVCDFKSNVASFLKGPRF